jgi:hypothetical protein
MVAQYKQIRETVQRGSLYRLISAAEGKRACLQVLRPNTSHPASTHEEDARKRIQHLAGVEESKYNCLLLILKYRFRDWLLSADAPAVASGSFQMQHGVDVICAAAIFRMRFLHWRRRHREVNTSLFRDSVPCSTVFNGLERQRDKEKEVGHFRQDRHHGIMG